MPPLLIAEIPLELRGTRFLAFGCRERTDVLAKLVDPTRFQSSLANAGPWDADTTSNVVLSWLTKFPAPMNKSNVVERIVADDGMLEVSKDTKPLAIVKLEPAPTATLFAPSAVCTA